MTQNVQRAGAQARPYSYSAFRKTPIALAISLVLFASQVVVAAEDAKKDDASELGEITVTGSRIRQAVGMETLSRLPSCRPWRRPAFPKL